MVGYSKKMEVALWIQTNTQAEVKFEYWEVSNPNEIFSTSSILTDKDSGFTGTFIADSVEPGRTYYYRPVINDEIITQNYFCLLVAFFNSGCGRLLYFLTSFLRTPIALRSWVSLPAGNSPGLGQRT